MIFLPNFHCQLVHNGKRVYKPFYTGKLFTVIMTNEEIEEKPSEEAPSEESKDETKVEGEIITPETPPVEPEKPCDPAIMTCNEMRDQIIELSDRRVTLEIGIKSLDGTKKIIPSEALDKAYNESLEEKEKIDNQIYGLFERFTVCTTPQGKEEKTEEQTEQTE